MKENIKTVLIFTLIGFLPDILNNLSEVLFGYSFPFNNEEVKDMTLDEIFFITVIIAPVLETLIFQTLVFQILLIFNFFKMHKWLIVILSAIIFSSFHNYSLHYLLFALYGGLILGIAYLKVYDKSNLKIATMVVITIHFLRNLIIFLAVDVFKII